MVTNPGQMAIAVVAVVLLAAALIVWLGPMLTTVKPRKQWALLVLVLIVLWLPMGWYLIYVVGQSPHVDQQAVIRAVVLNLGIGGPLFIFIAMNWILKKS